jgi:hypothetical protein
MNARDSVVFIWRAHLILILQEELCIKCYSSIDDKIPLHGLDSQHNRCGFQSHDGTNDMYTLEGSRHTQSLVRNLGGKCANPLPLVSNA